MGYEVSYNGVDLHSFMGILKVKRTILPPRENFSKKIPSMYGEIYTGYTYSPKVISLECYITANNYEDHMEQLRIIADILNVKEPQKLIISDEPDRFSYAVVDGQIDVERIKYHGSFNIDFICHDPYTYASEPSEAYPDSKNIIEIENSGSVKTHPQILVGFQNKAHFFQATNYTGETILIGQRPSNDKTSATGTTTALSEPCESMANWLPSGNVIDSGREIMGSAKVNGGGYAIIGNDFGTSEAGWHGSAYRRNIGSNVTDFEAIFTIEHNSKGDLRGTGSTANGTPSTGAVGSTGATTTAVKYTITADSLRIRSGRGTNYKQVGSIPKGKVVSVTDIQKNWGKVTYNGKTGYISMKYTKKYVAPTTTSTTSTYQATCSVNVRASASNKGKIIMVAKKGQQATVSSTTKDGWHKVTYNGKTGYSYKTYWKKVSSAKSIEEVQNVLSDSEVSRQINRATYAENKVGRIEVYGFDQNGTKLFKCVVRDSESYYEYTEPEAYIGNSLVLQDGKSTPAPKTVTKKDDNGKNVTTKIESGRFGDWNEFYGKFTVKRTTNSKKQQVWNIQVDKLVDGKVKKTLKTKSLVNSNYPTGALNHIVVWFGQYKAQPVVDVMSLNHVTVKNLKTVSANENTPIFKQGDELLIDCEEQMVYLNDRRFMDYVDIGSEFFGSPSGDSEFICASDDKNMDVYATFTEKWI